MSCSRAESSSHPSSRAGGCPQCWQVQPLPAWSCEKCHLQLDSVQGPVPSPQMHPGSPLVGIPAAVLAGLELSFKWKSIAWEKGRTELLLVCVFFPLS